MFNFRIDSNIIFLYLKNAYCANYQQEDERVRVCFDLTCLDAHGEEKNRKTKQVSNAKEELFYIYCARFKNA